jgi:hypothetical protein
MPSKCSRPDVVTTSIVKSCARTLALIVARLANLSFPGGFFQRVSRRRKSCNCERKFHSTIVASCLPAYFKLELYVTDTWNTERPLHKQRRRTPYCGCGHRSRSASAFDTIYKFVNYYYPLFYKDNSEMCLLPQLHICWDIAKIPMTCICMRW